MESDQQNEVFMQQMFSTCYKFCVPNDKLIEEAEKLKLRNCYIRFIKVFKVVNNAIDELLDS